MLRFESWQDFYASDLQGAYALVIVPALFLLSRLIAGFRRETNVAPEAVRFANAYAVVFGVATILDPLATGPLARAAGIADGPGATALMLLFVLLGDFRVFLLIAFLAARDGRLGRALGEAALWTLAVPLFTALADAALGRLVPGRPPHSIWLIYELAFLALALLLRQRIVPARVPGDRPALRRYLRGLTSYVAAYYALWAGADLIIQLAGRDGGWALRVLPNQLYYAFWVPFAYFTFFGRRPLTGPAPGRA